MVGLNSSGERVFAGELLKYHTKQHFCTRSPFVLLPNRPFIFCPARTLPSPSSLVCREDVYNRLQVSLTLQRACEMDRSVTCSVAAGNSGQPLWISFLPHFPFHTKNLYFFTFNWIQIWKSPFLGALRSNSSGQKHQETILILFNINL